MTALAHVHSDPESIRAALYRPCPPGIALDIWLDALADEHDEPAATPPPQRSTRGDAHGEDL
jgi:hypothetical protein